MTITQITKSFGTDTAHFLLNHPGKCQHLHGHRYTFDITLTGNMVENDHGEVATAGMLVDFTYLKQAFEETVGNWDHGILLPFTDEAFAASYDMLEELGLTEMLGLVNRDKIFCLGRNPTAENMSILAARKLAYWLAKYCPLALQIHSVAVRVWETPTSSAYFITGMPRYLGNSEGTDDYSRI